jgi:hypothetical protein
MGVKLSAFKARDKGLKEPSEEERAEQRLKTVKRRLESYKARSERSAGTLRDDAHARWSNGKREECRWLLQRARIQQGVAERVRAQLHAVDESLLDLQESVRTRAAYDAISMGTDSLKRLNDSLPLERIEQLNDDSADVLHHVEQVSQMLGMPSSSSFKPSDSELEAELGHSTATPEPPQISSPTADAQYATTSQPAHVPDERNNALAIDDGSEGAHLDDVPLPSRRQRAMDGEYESKEEEEPMPA